MKKRVLGFTIVELMVAIAVAAILIAIAAPNFSDMIKANHVQSQARELYSQLNYARSEAVSRGANILFCHSNNTSSGTPSCSGTWSDGWIICVDTNQNGSCDAGERLLRVYSDLGQNTLSVVDGAGTPVAQDYFSFSRTGGVAGSASSGVNFTAKICDSGNNVKYARAILVTAAGQILASSQDTTTGNYTDVNHGDLACP